MVGSSRNSSRRPMQQRRGQVAAHALPQAELPYRHRPAAGLQGQQLHQLVARLPVRAGLQPVDVAQQVERLEHRQVPPELAALAEHHPDLGHVRPRAAPRHVARPPGSGRRRAPGCRTGSSRWCSCRRRWGRCSPPARRRRCGTTPRRGRSPACGGPATRPARGRGRYPCRRRQRGSAWSGRQPRSAVGRPRRTAREVLSRETPSWRVAVARRQRQAGPKMAATVHCPVRRFHGLRCHGVTVVTHVRSAESTATRPPPSIGGRDDRRRHGCTGRNPQRAVSPGSGNQPPVCGMLWSP